MLIFFTNKILFIRINIKFRGMEICFLLSSKQNLTRMIRRLEGIIEDFFKYCGWKEWILYLLNHEILEISDC